MINLSVKGGIMVLSGQKSVFDSDTLSFLESVSAKTAAVPQKIDTEIIKQALQYNVNLDELEGVDGRQNLTSINEQDIVLEEEKKPEIEEDIYIEQLDVRLSDLISRVFENCEKVIVIVRDDKVEYINKTALKLLELSNPSEILKENFLKFVDKSQWNILAENIGVMLTENKSLTVNIKDKTGHIHPLQLEAIYLPDTRHFSFILIGERDKKPVLSSGFFDTLTGLPNFYLFEDRVQVAVNNENYKNPRSKKNMLAVVGVSIDNLAEFEKINMSEFVLKKLSSKLVLSLKKHYSIARGLKYQFWILINDIYSREDLNIELEKIRAVLDEPLKDNFTEHNLSTSIGVSVFPDVAKSAKKLLEQSITAVQIAQKRGGKDMYIYLADSDEKTD